MGWARRLLVAVFSCIFLLNLAGLTNSSSSSTPSSRPTKDSDHTDSTTHTELTNHEKKPRELKIDVRLQDKEEDSQPKRKIVVFDWTQTFEPSEDAEYERRYKSVVLACDKDKDKEFTSWISAPRNTNYTFLIGPHTNTTLEVRLKNNTDKVARKSFVTDATEPNTRVTKLQGRRNQWTATVEDKCKKYNGDHMKVRFVLERSSGGENPDSLVMNNTVNLTDNKAKIEYPQSKLVPFTNHIVTAIPTNDKGDADASLCKTEKFLTKATSPGKVGSLKVVKAYPYCLNVTWEPPNDHPPRGILETFIVKWIILPLTTIRGNHEVNGSTTSMLISELEPNKSYKITVTAKNEGVNKESQKLSIIGNTTQVNCGDDCRNTNNNSQVNRGDASSNTKECGDDCHNTSNTNNTTQEDGGDDWYNTTNTNNTTQEECGDDCHNTTNTNNTTQEECGDDCHNTNNTNQEECGDDCHNTTNTNNTTQEECGDDCRNTNNTTQEKCGDDCHNTSNTKTTQEKCGDDCHNTSNTNTTQVKCGDDCRNTSNTTQVKCDDDCRNTSNTTQDRDPKRQAKTRIESNKTTLSFHWKITWKEIAYYAVSLSEGEVEIRRTNTTKTTIQFGNLTAATKYRVRVMAVTVKGKSLYIRERVAWTKPDEPKVAGAVQCLAVTPNSITLQLPILQNPPGYHWVLMKKNGGQGSDAVKASTNAIQREAIEVIKKSEKTRHKRDLDTTERELSSCGLRIVNVIQVVTGDDKQVQSVTVDQDGSEGTSAALETDTQYLVVIVTEKRAGDYSEYFPCEPQVFETQPDPVLAAVGTIAGICGGAVVLVAVGMLLAVRCTGQRVRRKKIPITRNACMAEANPALVHEDERIPLTDYTNGSLFMADEMTKIKQELDQKFVVQEEVYANICHQVSRQDLDIYLSRAMFATETTLEFTSVPFFMPGKTAAESRLPQNVPKNRYKNEISYDDTRVRLPLYNNVPHTDYINANYVQDPLGREVFIATQGPKDHSEDTTGAFWRMVWHTQCSLILMVANIMESGRVKVAQYWPDTEPLVKEGVRVTLTSVRIVMDFTVRTFIVAVDDIQREVSQYQYTAWPDHGVPQTAYGLSQMLKTALKHYSWDPSGPITVHCSAGIGRTGTVILTLFLLRQLEAFNAVNTRKALETLRKGRGRLVENKEQYVFVHKLLHEILFGLNTTFMCDSFLKTLPTLRSAKAPDGTLLLHKEFQKVKNLPKDLTFKIGKDPTCAYLNRNQDILPADKRMVFLPMQGQGMDSQYLNIIRINGFDRKDAYLAGEHPQPHTLAKLWCLVYEREVSVWLLLQELPRNNDSSFPDVVQKLSFVPPNMSVKISEPRHLENFTEYSVSITVKEMGGGGGGGGRGCGSHKCKLLILRGWPHTANLPPFPTALLGGIEKAESIVSQTQTPLLFTCRDGVTGCGVLAALLLAVSRAKLTQEVDLYRSVVSVQYDRPQFILDFDQYKFLYTAMEVFLDNNKHYGNFAPLKEI